VKNPKEIDQELAGFAGHEKDEFNNHFPRDGMLAKDS